MDNSLSTVLFFGEVFFTGLKAFALSRRNVPVLKYVAVPCFILESGLGIALSALLLRTLVATWVGPIAYILTAGAGLIMATELMSVLSEGASIARKVRARREEGCARRLCERQRWRAVVNWVAYWLSGVSSCCLYTVVLFSSVQWFNESTVERGVVMRKVVPVATTAVFLVASIPRLCAAMGGLEKKGLRIAAGCFLTVSGAIGATVFNLTAKRAPLTLTQDPHALDYQRVEPITPFLLGTTSALTAAAFWGLPDVPDDGPHSAHVHAFEVAAFGSTPPGVFLALLTPAKEARQILIAVVPQITALVAPFLFSYCSFLWRTTRRGQADGKTNDTASSASSKHAI